MDVRSMTGETLGRMLGVVILFGWPLVITYLGLAYTLADANPLDWDQNMRFFQVACAAGLYVGQWVYRSGALRRG